MSKHRLARTLLRAAVTRVARSLVRRAHQNLIASRSFTETLEPRQLLARATGIDVSHYSGTVNWQTIAASGYTFAYAKATEGGSVTDADMTTNLTAGANAGVIMGAYHHAKPDAGSNDAVNEANWFVNQAGNFIKPGYLRPALDVSEGATGTTGGTLSKAQLSTWVNTFLSTVKTATGVEPVVYTNNDYATNYLDSSVAANHDLWIARWSTAYGTPTATGSPPTGAWGGVGETWDFWQYKNDTPVSGVSGTADLDVFNGDRAALDSFVIGGTGTPSFALNLDFGPAGASVPSGYVNVANTLFGTQSGQQMGWLQSGVTTDSRSAGSAPDVRYRTFAMPALGGVSRSFEVAVSNGSYTVRVVTGSPDQYPNAQKITVEGVTAVNASTSSTTPFISGTVTVNVTDGRLTLGSDYNGSANTRLDFVDITSNTPAATGFQTGVAFGPDGSAAVPGYRTDLGNFHALRSNGYTFGWVDGATGADALNAGNSFERTLPAGSDPRLGRGITTDGKSWEMDVPNGNYFVTLVAGDANVSSGTYGYNIEGASFLRGTASSGNGRWITATGKVTVTDGKLTISNASGMANHALAYVEITDYAAHNRTTVAAPIAVTATAASGTSIDVRWTDKSDNDTGFKVERLDANGTPTLLGTTYSNAGLFTDSNASPNATYTYRVTALNGTAASSGVVSNAITTPAASAGQIPYNVARTAWTTETTIQAEDFDAGGPNVSYLDTINGNAGGYYRAGNEDVGYNVADDHYFLGWNRAGEWVEYTVNVPTAGTYQFQTSVASEGTGGKFAVAMNGTTKASNVQVPDTTAFTTYQTLTTGTFTLAAGDNQVLRLTATSDDPTHYWVGDIDWLKLVKVGAPAAATVSGYVWNDRNQNHVRDSSLLQGNPPSVVLVVDVSGSTTNQFAGTPVGNANRDPYSDTILDAEIDGVIALNEQMIRAGQGNTANVSLVTFSDGASTLDVNPVLAGTQVFTHPSTDANNNGVPDIEEAARQLYSDNNTNFEAGLQQAIAALASAQVAPGNGNVVFLSDGFPNVGDAYDDEVATLRADDVQLDAFGMGAGAGMDALRVIDPAAVEITSTDQVIDTFDGATGSQVIEEALAGRRVFADVNGNGAYDAGEPSTLTGADGSYSLGGLAAGTYTIAEVLQTGWTRTTPTGGTYQVTLVAGDVVKDRKFGEYQPDDAGNTGNGGGGNHLPSPVANATQPATIVKVGKTFSWNAGAAFTDADGDTLQFKPDPLLPLPSGMTLNPTTGQFTWTPQASQVGMTKIAYLVSDGHTGSDYFGEFNLLVLTASTILPPAASIAVSTTSIYESNAGVTTFTVTLDDAEGITNPITVNLDWSGSTAVASDYTLTNPTGTSLPTSVTIPLPASGTFGTGPQSVSFSVKAADDGVSDGNKSLSVNVTSGGGYTVGSPTNAEVTVIDDGSSTPTGPVPDWPQNVKAKTVSVNEVDLTWDAFSSVSPTTSYNIYRNTDQNFVPDPSFLVGTSPTPTFQDQSVSAGVKYFYTVVAVQQDGSVSQPSFAGNTITSAITAFDTQPTNLESTFSDDSTVHLSWSDRSGNESGFVVQRIGEFDSDWQIVGTLDPDESSFYDEGIDPEISYEYRVVAVSATQPLAAAAASAPTTDPAPGIADVHKGLVEVFGGFTQTGDPTEGTSKMAKFFGDYKLPSAGGNLKYNVKLYRGQSDVDLNDRTGLGKAYDEVINYINNGVSGPKPLALIGYSWGGGAVYTLAKSLFQNGKIGNGPNQVQLVMTGYMDAIRHQELGIAETRRPLGTQFHVNFYETTGIPHGNMMDNHGFDVEEGDTYTVPFKNGHVEINYDEHFYTIFRNALVQRMPLDTLP